jgi:hypothetical protein
VNDPNYYDQGLCVPTTAAMVIGGALSEKDPKTKLFNAYLDGFFQRPWFENVVLVGLDAKTNFVDGGRLVYRAFTSTKKYFKNTQAAEYLDINSNFFYRLGIQKSTESFISDIKKDKRIFAIGVSRSEFREKKIFKIKNTWYERQGGHALVIKGFEGKNLMIQDPWGYSYFARAEQRTFKAASLGINRQHTVFEAVKTGNGWMPSYRDPIKYKLVLDESYSVALH